MNNSEIIEEALSLSDRIQKASEMKEEGNGYFKQKRFKKALNCYSKGITLLFPSRSFHSTTDPNYFPEIHSLLAILLLNSAANYLQLEQWKKAKWSCTKIICDEYKTEDLWPLVDRRYFQPGEELLNKVFFRRASAWLGLACWKESLADINLCKLPRSQKEQILANIQRVRAAEEEKEKEIYKRIFN